MQQELDHAIVEAFRQAKILPDRLTLQREAWHALLVVRPELRVEGAIALYRQGAISFARAAELSGLSQRQRFCESGATRTLDPAFCRV